MAYDDHLCNTGLLLGLGFPSTQNSKSKAVNQITENPTNDHAIRCLEPSLTLGFSGEMYPIGSRKIDVNKVSDVGDYLNRQASSQSVVSSFSEDRVKRERDRSSEDVGVEKVSSRFSYENEDGCNVRKKLRLTKDQSALLEESFKLNSNLNPKQKQALARQLSLRPRQVEVWFQNRRARTKLKQTERDFDFLKKCCETLTDENRRLQKEIQELKTLKLAQPSYMHMPLATLNLCPSCERLNKVVSKTPFSMSSKPTFYNPFANPSAAC